VDNGSSDETPALLARFAEANRRLRSVTCTEIGIAPARNHGVGASRGALVLVCDADDVVAPGWVEAMAAALAEDDVVGGRIDVEALNRPSVRAARGSPTANGLPAAFAFLPYAVGANLGFRREVFDALGGFD